MLTLAEVKNLTEYTDIELYTAKDRDHRNFHSDYIKSYEGEEKDELLIVDYQLMDEDDYNHSVVANTCVSADFTEWYGDKDAKVLVCIVAEGIKQKMYAVCSETSEIPASESHSESDILSAFTELRDRVPEVIKLCDNIVDANELLKTIHVSTSINGKTAVAEIAYIESGEYEYVDGEWEYCGWSVDIENYICEAVEEDEE